MHFLGRLAPPYPTLHITTVSIDVIPQYNAQASDRRLECCTKECVPISSSAEPLPGSHIIILYSSRPAGLSPQSFRLADVLGEFLDERQVDVDLAGKSLHVQLTSGAHLGHGLRHTLCHHTQGTVTSSTPGDLSPHQSPALSAQGCGGSCAKGTCHHRRHSLHRLKGEERGPSLKSVIRTGPCCLPEFTALSPTDGNRL